MKVELEISEKRILVLIDLAAKHNNVEITEVTDEMFEEELGKAVKHFLFK